jgi:hypothetical protein
MFPAAACAPSRSTLTRVRVRGARDTVSEAKGTSDQAPRGCDGGFPGCDARSEAQPMARLLGKPSDKADRPESPVPPGCGKMRRLRRCAPRLRRLNYDLRRAPRIHPHFASNAIRGGLNQRFLKCGSGSMSAPLHNVSCGSLRPFPLHAYASPSPGRLFFGFFLLGKQKKETCCRATGRKTPPWISRFPAILPGTWPDRPVASAFQRPCRSGTQPLRCSR